MTSLHRALGPALWLLAGCSPFPSPDQLTAPACDASGWTPAAELTPAEPPDYLLVFGPLFSERSFADARGARCDGATDVAACEATLEDARQDYGGLVMRYGDEVRTYFDLASVVAALTPIDTEAEAMLVAFFAGHGLPECAGNTVTGARRVGDGFEVVSVGEDDSTCESIAFRSERNEIHYRHLVSVTASGETARLATEAAFSVVCEDTCMCFE